VESRAHASTRAARVRRVNGMAFAVARETVMTPVPLCCARIDAGWRGTDWNR
jgi:hypothetical protein